MGHKEKTLPNLEHKKKFFPQGFQMFASHLRHEHSTTGPTVYHGYLLCIRIIGYVITIKVPLFINYLAIGIVKFSTIDLNDLFVVKYP